MDNSQSQSMNQEGPTEAPPKLPEGWLGEYFWANLRAMSDILFFQLSGRGPAGNFTMFNEPLAIRNGKGAIQPLNDVTHSIYRELPTEPALSVPTPDATPQPTTDPFNRPSEGDTRSHDDGPYEGADRGFMSVSSYQISHYP